MESYLVDVQRCSTHDGPGIRTTVFFKGCPIRCTWCHNPESQNFKRQLSFIEGRCTKCGRCEAICPKAVHRVENEGHHINFNNCMMCEQCVKTCVVGALEVKGKKFDLDEVMGMILQDVPYYKKSKGGVTLSGGEVLSHAQAAVELLKACKKKKIHTCIETSGVGSVESMQQIAAYTDLILYDYKHTNEAMHKQYVGTGRQRVLENLEVLQKIGSKVILRCPIIPEVNDATEHFEGISEITKKYSIIEAVELLPYHNTGRSKATSIGEQQEIFRTPTKEEVEDWKVRCTTLEIKII